ncbi:hypothetical protein ABB37_07857 [Leptomonas pyrrhocoris]|uniref:Uncharacterized protein n=1 Tax=Leptomonas pyrrhocoris TaxID=157538 RepID=A0A0M9FV12_LEPPY|nr:hypothetical protein ABB37_07857 [Leptomonas pyrrhocoris]KPA76573.1 hypothetical protein ABB37_07857 [Leptomonas pyrrhocoris]|eukprot:XP_015655012.1 hypothetical protein ABB37_07857 [Leptomonas pyrrhocoris]
MATPSSEQPVSSSYVDMLVKDKESGTLAALETIREAGNEAHVHNDAHSSSVDPTDAHKGGGGGVSGTRQRQQRSRGREVAFRVSTPERIRRRSEVLYGEIHTMMERHDARTGREREVQRRVSRGSRVASPEGSHNKARRGDCPAQGGSTASPQTPLPDIHQMFEESRRAHLTEAQQQRTYFPSSSKPTTYSSKDPSTFSYRFQSMGSP